MKNDVECRIRRDIESAGLFPEPGDTWRKRRTWRARRKRAGINKDFHGRMCFVVEVKSISERCWESGTYPADSWEG